MALALTIVAPTAGTVTASASTIGESVTTIWTDFGGTWKSDAVATVPNNDQNLIAFTSNGVVYSTGVNDALLSGVTFTASTWEALPVEGLPTTSSANYFVARGYAAPGKPGFPANPTSAQLASFLTDGTRGLNLGSGITNIPAGTTLTFNLVGGVASGALSDGIPDILITQIANPTTTKDYLEFRDASNARVGNRVDIDQQASASISRLGGTSESLEVHYYTIPGATDAPSPFDFSTQGVRNAVRLRSYQLSEFGLTGANIGSVTKLVWGASGSSDPAFFAYNTASLSVVGGSTSVGSSTTTLNPISDTALTDGSVTAVATNDQGIALTYSTTTTSVCTVDSSTGVVTLVAVGTCTITAGHAQTQIGSTIYPASSDSKTFAVTGAGPPAPPPESEPDTAPPAGPPAIGLDVLGPEGGPADSLRLDILATGLPPGTPYRLAIRAPERVLLEGVAPASGVLSQRVPLPADVGQGTWTVVWIAQLEGQQPLVLSRNITLSSDRTVVDTGTTIVGDPGAPRRLAYTGFETAILPWWALAILVGGLLLWAYGYRARKFYEAELQKRAVREKTPWEILATPIRVSFIPYTPTLDESAPPQQAQSLSECIQDLDRSISYLLGAKLSQMRRQLASPL